MNSRALSLSVCLVAGACVTVRPVAAPVNFIPEQQPQLVWVTANDGEVIPLADPAVRGGDTLVGRWHGSAEPVSVPLSRVRSIYARQPDRRRTALLVASAVAVAGFIAWRATGRAGSSPCVFDSGNNWWTCPQ